MGNINSATPIPQDKWKKWVKNLKDDAGNSDYLNFDNIAVPRDFYSQFFKTTGYYPFVYYGLTDEGNYCLVIIPLDNNYKPVKKDVYYVFEANKPYTIVDKKAKQKLCKNWKDVAKNHKIKLIAFTVPQDNFSELFKNASVNEVYFTISEDTDETNDYYKIKPLMSAQKITDSSLERTLDGDGDPDPPLFFNSTNPCPPICHDLEP
jgi:hypothetical protein